MRPPAERHFLALKAREGRVPGRRQSCVAGRTAEALRVLKVHSKAAVIVKNRSSPVGTNATPLSFAHSGCKRRCTDTLFAQARPYAGGGDAGGQNEELPPLGLAPTRDKTAGRAAPRSPAVHQGLSPRCHTGFVLDAPAMGLLLRPHGGSKHCQSQRSDAVASRRHSTRRKRSARRPPGPGRRAVDHYLMWTRSGAKRTARTNDFVEKMFCGVGCQ